MSKLRYQDVPMDEMDDWLVDLIHRELYGIIKTVTALEAKGDAAKPYLTPENVTHLANLFAAGQGLNLEALAEIGVMPVIEGGHGGNPDRLVGYELVHP